MAHIYNTRLRKVTGDKSEEDTKVEPGKITGYLRPLEIEFDKEIGNKKAKKESTYQGEEVDMELTDKLHSGSDT